MDTANFLFPRDLEVTPTGLKKIMIIGSCLAESYVRHFRHSHPDVTFDYVLFNNASELPEVAADVVASYDLQYIQIPLRSVLTDAAIRISDNDQASRPLDWLEVGRQNIALMLESAMSYGRGGKLLTLVSNFIVPQGRISPSLDDQDSDDDLVSVVRELNVYLSRKLRDYPNAFLADIDMIANSHGKKFFLDDSIGFYTHGAMFYSDWAAQERFPHWTSPEPGRIEEIQELALTYENRHEEFFNAVFRQIEFIFRVVRQLDSVKVVIFDLDNTMWRGQLAEHYQQGQKWPHSDGWPLGIWEAIHHLRRRGIIATISSKNDEGTVSAKWADAVQPPFVKFEDFVQPKINWRPKAENIRQTLSELSLTPRSALFIDDNPVERESVKASLPGIRVLGADPFVVRRILLWASETQLAKRTDESSRREEMLKRQVEREKEKATMSREEFLHTLESKLFIAEIIDITGPSFARVSELVNKTNQFNTNGKRWAAADYVAHFKASGRVFYFAVRDRFTDYGIVGVVFLLGSQVIQFVMSCRVLGMDIEVSVLAFVVQQVRLAGQEIQVSGNIQLTETNTPCRDLYQRAGFREQGSNNYVLAGGESCLASSHVETIVTLA